jgi:hypothetical protein
MLLCDRVEANAFRVLRLSGRSKYTEIQEAATALMRAVTLGYAGITEADLPSVRAAVDALDNPRLRIEHRLFWFHDPGCMENTTGAQTPAALDVVEAAHDKALRCLIAAYFEDESETSGMASALVQWHGLICQPAYWDALSRIEFEGAFEAGASAEDLSDLRSNAMILAAEPFEEAAQDSWANKEFPVVRGFISGLNRLEHTGRWASDCRHRMICRITAPLADACGIFADRYRAQISYRNGTEASNEPVCLEELQHFRGSIEPAWNDVSAALPEDETELRLSRGQAADCLASIAIDHTWAGKHIIANELAAEAIALAAGTIAEPRIRLTLSGLLAATEERNECEINDAIWTSQNVAEELTEEAPDLAQASAETEQKIRDEKIEDEFVELQQSAEVDSQSESSLSPDSALELVRQRCAILASTFAGKIVAKKECIEQNRLICSEELAYFRTQIEPALSQALQSLPPSTPLLSDLREQVAVCLANIATHHICAEELTVTERLMTESLQLAQGTWAAQTIQNKYLLIRESSGKLPLRKRDYWRIAAGVAASVSLAAILLVTLMSNPVHSASIAAAPRPNTDSLSDPLKKELDQNAVQLKSLEPRIQTGREHAAVLEGQIRTLHNQIESIKEDRAAGSPVDYGDFNSKLHSYSTLLRTGRKVLSEVDADVRLRDELVDQRKLLLDELTRDRENAQ